MFSNFIYFLVALIIYTTADLFGDASVFEGGVVLYGLMINILFVMVCQTTFRFLEKKSRQHGFDMIDHLVNVSISRLSGLALIVFAIDVYGLRLHLYLESIRIFHLFPTLGALLFMVLFLFYQVVIWDAAFRLQKHFFSGTVSRRDYVLSNLLFSLPALLPWFSISIVSDILALIDWGPLDSWLDSPLGTLGYVAIFIIAIAVFGPVLIKRLWRCRPLAPGSTRSYIETVCRQADLKYADILRWDLFGGNMVTAGVMGLVGRFRYILVTPALLNSLYPAEIRGVMLHEIGHVQRHHMVFYLLLFAGFIACNYVFFEPVMLGLYLLAPLYQLGQTIGLQQEIVHSMLVCTVLIGTFIIYFRYVFGFYMRTFERQADLHIFKFFDDASALISTFYKIASLSRQSLEKPNWHHFSIGQRIRFLQACQESPWLIDGYHRRVKMLVTGYLVVVLSVFFCGYTISYGAAKDAFDNYIAEKFLFQQMDLHPENAELYAMVGDYYYDKENYEKAVASYQNVLRVAPDNIHALNNLAWLYATCPEPRYRNPGLSLQYAAKALSLEKAAYILDTYAEALFAGGDAAGAVTAAREALTLAGKNLDKGKKDYYRGQVRRFERFLEQEALSRPDA